MSTIKRKNLIPREKFLCESIEDLQEVPGLLGASKKIGRKMIAALAPWERRKLDHATNAAALTESAEGELAVQCMLLGLQWNGVVGEDVRHLPAADHLW